MSAGNPSESGRQSRFGRSKTGRTLLRRGLKARFFEASRPHSRAVHASPTGHSPLIGFARKLWSRAPSMAGQPVPSEEGPCGSVRSRKMDRAGPIGLVRRPSSAIPRAEAPVQAEVSSIRTTDLDFIASRIFSAIPIIERFRAAFLSALSLCPHSTHSKWACFFSPLGRFSRAM